MVFGSGPDVSFMLKIWRSQRLIPLKQRHDVLISSNQGFRFADEKVKRILLRASCSIVQPSTVGKWRPDVSRPGFKIASPLDF